MSELGRKRNSIASWFRRRSAQIMPVLFFSAMGIRGGIFCAALFCVATPTQAGDERSIKEFRQAIVALAPDIDPAEAELLSVTAHTTARQLARDYRIAGPSVFQNFLIHIGARERGFCFHWARDIGARLKELRLKTLVLHWGASGAGTRLEHNCVVVTARGQSFREGIIIDGWRNAGRLLCWPVVRDTDYAWKEDLRETAWLQEYGRSEQKSETATRGATTPVQRAGRGVAVGRGS